MLYHLVCPAKYRRKIFTEAVETTLKNICLDIAECYDIRFIEIGTDHDHVHFLLQTIPMMLPTRMVATIKSITARELFRRHPEIKRMLWGGNVWTSGYYLNTVGQYGNEAIIKQYVQNQGKTYRQLHRQPTLFDNLE